MALSWIIQIHGFYTTCWTSRAVANGIIYLDSLGSRKIITFTSANCYMCGLVQGISEMHLLGIPAAADFLAGSILIVLAGTKIFIIRRK